MLVMRLRLPFIVLALPVLLVGHQLEYFATYGWRGIERALASAGGRLRRRDRQPPAGGRDARFAGLRGEVRSYGPVPAWTGERPVIASPASGVYFVPQPQRAARSNILHSIGACSSSFRRVTRVRGASLQLPGQVGGDGAQCEESEWQSERRMLARWRGQRGVGEGVSQLVPQFRDISCDLPQRSGAREAAVLRDEPHSRGQAVEPLRHVDDAKNDMVTLRQT